MVCRQAGSEYSVTSTAVTVSEVTASSAIWPTQLSSYGDYRTLARFADQTMSARKDPLERYRVILREQHRTKSGGTSERTYAARDHIPTIEAV